LRLSQCLPSWTETKSRQRRASQFFTTVRIGDEFSCGHLRGEFTCLHVEQLQNITGFEFRVPKPVVGEQPAKQQSDCQTIPITANISAGKSLKLAHLRREAKQAEQVADDRVYVCAARLANAWFGQKIFRRFRKAADQ